MLELTKSNEDYLEAIGLLSEKNGTAQVRDIAEMLKVKMPSVTSSWRIWDWWSIRSMLPSS